MHFNYAFLENNYAFWTSMAVLGLKLIILKKSSICYSGGGETCIGFLPFFLNVPSYARIFDVSGGVVSTDLSEDTDAVQIRKQTN